MSIQQSESIAQLATALAKAQGEFPVVPKTKTADTGKYSYEYADLADVVEAVRPILAKHELAVTALPYTRKNGKAALTTQIMHSSGEWIRGSLDLLLTQPTPQGVGGAITYARRQAQSAALNIVTDSDDDATLASQVGGGRTRVKAPRAPRDDGRGASDDEASRLLGSTPGGRASKDQVVEVNAAMDAAGLASTAKARRDYLSGLTGRAVMSAGELDADEVPGILDRLELAKEAG